MKERNVQRAKRPVISGCRFFPICEKIIIVKHKLNLLLLTSHGRWLELSRFRFSSLRPWFTVVNYVSNIVSALL